MTEAEQIMKRCQVGTRNYNEANNLHAECYRVIGKLLKTIEDMESKESNPIKDGWQLSVADGHSGYGVYAHMNEYPEEGAFLLLPIKELESQEPIYQYQLASGAWIDQTKESHDYNVRHGQATVRVLNTHPPQRTWAGLTEQEQGAIMEDINAYGAKLYSFADAIEAKLKERNT
jgi:hypothetical protein